MTFEELGVRSRALTALSKQGITEPNPVQRESIPALNEGRDVVIEAPTGSGKTLAFLLPMVARLGGHKPSERDAEVAKFAAPRKSDVRTRDFRDGRRGRDLGRNAGPASRPDHARALIVGPTRELATQIADVLRGLNMDFRIALLYGGVPYGNQLRALRDAPDVVIGCPGRILDLANQGVVKFNNIEYLVLDEGDEMFDQGFAKDVEKIIAMTQPTRQTVLASATMPDWVTQTINRNMKDPARVRVIADVEPALEHGLMAVNRSEKVETLHKLLRAEKGQTIVFHKTKHGAKKLAKDLNNRGHFAAELQGNLSQNARDKAISSFRKGDTWVLVATNVAARGIDVVGVGLVVNYELPDTPQWLTHRIGRTARNGADGRALTFLSEDDGAQWKKLRRLGAPNLPHVDGDRLLENGEWVYMTSAPESRDERSSSPSRPSHRIERSQSSRPSNAGNRPSYSGDRSRSSGKPSYGGQSSHSGERSGYGGDRSSSTGERRRPTDTRPEGRAFRADSRTNKSDRGVPRPTSTNGEGRVWSTGPSDDSTSRSYSPAHTNEGRPRRDSSNGRSGSQSSYKSRPYSTTSGPYKSRGDSRPSGSPSSTGKPSGNGRQSPMSRQRDEARRSSYGSGRSFSD